MRWKAIELLARHYRDNPDLLSLLPEGAIAEKHGFVRLIIMKTLAEQYRDNPEILVWFKDCATTPKNPGVRRKAMKAIAELYGNDSTAFDLLSNCVLDDPFVRQGLLSRFEENPRQTALKGLITQIDGEKKSAVRQDCILVLLHLVIAKDTDNQFRRWAQRELAARSF